MSTWLKEHLRDEETIRLSLAKVGIAGCVFASVCFLIGFLSR